MNFNEQLRFCTFSIQIYGVNFDPSANLTRTYEEKCILYIYIWPEIGTNLSNESTERRVYHGITCELFRVLGLGFRVRIEALGFGLGFVPLSLSNSISSTLLTYLTCEVGGARPNSKLRGESSIGNIDRVGG